MIPNEIELRCIEQRFLDLRREASAYRLARAYRPTRASRPSLLDRVRALRARLHLIRPATAQAKAASS
jgi:hypothetical protein